MSKKNKKARYAIINISMKSFSKIIKDFEKFAYKGYVQKSSKKEPTEIFFYLSIQLAKCMLGAYALNLHFDPVRTEINGTQQIPISHIFYLEKSELKKIHAEKHYRKSIMRTRANQKALSLIKFLWRKVNQKAFTKVSTQTKKNT